MPDGSEKYHGDELFFHNVNRHHSGVYVCMADNGFSNPAKDKIEVQVDYAPEIETQEVYIHAQTGNEVELVCNVHAHPSAVIKWFKNSMELTEDKHRLNNKGHKSSLKLTQISESDFGNYTCRAENRLGSSYRILEVSGIKFNH